MKKTFLFLMMTLLFCIGSSAFNDVKAQDVVTIGDPETEESDRYVIDTYNNTSISQQFYTHSEINRNGGGTISHIAFKVASVKTVKNNEDIDVNITENISRSIKIYMRNEASFSFSGNSTATFSDEEMVYDGEILLGQHIDWVTLELTEPFTYESGKDILVCVSDVTGYYTDYKIHFATFKRTSLYKSQYSNTKAYNVAESISANTSNNTPCIQFTFDGESGGEGGETQTLTLSVDKNTIEANGEVATFNVKLNDKVLTGGYTIYEKIGTGGNPHPNNTFSTTTAGTYTFYAQYTSGTETLKSNEVTIEATPIIVPIALTANPEEVTVGENITFTVWQGTTDVTSASKFYIEDVEITNPYTTTVAGTFTIRAEKDGLEATTSIIVNEAVEPDPEDPVTPGNGETIYNKDGSVTYNKGLENEYTLIAVQDPNTGVVTIKEDNVYYYGSGTELQIAPKDNNKPHAATVLTIPEKVLFQTEEVTDWVTVTKIADYAFDNWFEYDGFNSYEPGNELNDNFTDLIIPSTIEEIGTYTFGFEMGGSIICYAQTPPALSSTTNNNPFLRSTYNNTILYVLPESIDAYKEARGWGTAAYSGYYFKNIAPLTIPTFVAKVDNNWNNANNWRTYIKNATDDNYTETYGVMPNAGEDVLINGEAIIPAGYTANVGAINIVSGGITIEDGGQLIHTNAGVTVTVEKEIKGYNATREGVASTAWNTISSPIAVMTPTNNVSGLLNGAYDLYYYDEPTHYWMNKEEIANNFETLDAGRGYLYANENDVTLKFNGVINYDNVSFDLDASSEYEGLFGFNLIGNPFTHDIYMGGNIYSENLVIDGYYSLSQEGQWGAKKASSSAIAPCQGILVQTSKEETINIVKVAAAPAAPARSAQAALNITVVNEQYEDNAYVIFNDGKGLNKVGHMNENIPMVYVIDNNEKFAIANIDDANEIALGFEAMTMGEYTIAVKAQDCKFNNMILTDNITGEKTNLMTDSYTFMATTNDEPNRFTLTLNNDNDNDNDFIYINNNEMIINNIEGNGLVQIYDMMGRSVATYNVSGSANINMETLSNGVYVVRMTDANGVKTQKVVNN